MNRTELIAQIRAKKSFLCVGLDPDLKKLPPHLLTEKDPIFEFNKQIIDATAQYAVAYKPNIAFYEALGLNGWQSLQRTLDYIPKNCFTIADAKRGDIGNTSLLYARAFFDKNSSGMSFDSITVAPYMGRDSVTPFLEFEGKWVILLALTSNTGSADFQTLTIETDGQSVFEKVLTTAQTWANADQLMFVVGATQAHALTRVRAIAPDNFLLIPGVGAQGGSLSEVCKYGLNQDCGLLVNASRSILYAASGVDFAAAAAAEAQQMQAEMARELLAHKIV
jgi:orotidine-5'-phosphate decarboxylase